ncbi:MAG: endonuclease MutS2 [Bacteroidetes bacterium]|nr:MAG: endonuclease MutS2 [Bacteroidota bacterium]
MNNNIEEEQKIIDDTLDQLEFPVVLDTISKLCFSEPGQEIILKLKPTKETYWLRKEHDLTEEIINLQMADEKIPFEGFKDIRQKLYKSLVQNAILLPEEILDVISTIRSSRLIKSFFAQRNEKYPKLNEESNNLHENRLLEKHIEETISETGEVKDNATKELARVRKEIISKSSKLRNRLQTILKKVSDEELLQEDFISLREGRFVLPVKVEHKRHLTGIIHGMSQTGSTVFIEPAEVIEMNNELSLLFNEEKREIHRILTNLTAEIGDEAKQFLLSIDIIAHIDSISARAKYAIKYSGMKPVITEENEIFLSNIRHPILVQSKGTGKVIPLTIEFDKTRMGHLISGPNAGGKTVALKSIGLNIAMALSGIYTLGYCKTNFRWIFSAIGDHQSIQNDLSTFSSQIIQLKNILSFTDRNALVLIDEIGSGTDPQEGTALASGILDSFLEVNSFFVATTHQSSLKSYALTRAEIENDSLEFDDKQLKPTYKFLQGVPGNSYAFQLAENLGLPAIVLNRGRKYLGDKQSELEDSITILQRFKSEAEELRIKAENEKIQSEKLRLNYEEKLKDIKQKRQSLIDNAHKEAYQIIDSANALIENTIKEIREEKKQVTEIKQEFAKTKKSLEKKIRESEQLYEIEETQHEFHVGENVISSDSNITGVILEINTENQTALCNFNGVKFKLPLKNLIPVKAPKPTKSTTISEHIRFDISSSIDLRGKRAAEALRELDEFISNAIMSNINTIQIIHGKGTGALRQAIHEFLANHPSNLSFREGTLVEGGAGVTFIDLL